MANEHQNTVELNGENLTFEEVLAVAYSDPGLIRVELSDLAKERIDVAARAVQQIRTRLQLGSGSKQHQVMVVTRRFQRVENGVVRGV